MPFDYWNVKQANQATAFEFIAVELELAITFVMAATSAISATSAKRNADLAKEAYGSATRFLSRIDLDAEMAEYLNKKMTRVQDLLAKLT